MSTPTDAPAEVAEAFRALLDLLGHYNTRPRPDQETHAFPPVDRAVWEQLHQHHGWGVGGRPDDAPTRTTDSQ
ncbi:hypothetical protein Val02_09410 [Virgisporangium aliadipatigenens]|uniref:Uncharacterized protein n=1 Tax=Virgisporangium aliadipatigenens TaxID=741659 RepID=A0A8J3YHF8_9ACTN|nr:hypothetical protein [Virgisporangium aliadipatigenens]GIJ44055.1 hypothetical protein Val02_09410 [Virgisporangium aliadipatigenens]